jgi:hypothetical protein
MLGKTPEQAGLLMAGKKRHEPNRSLEAVTL